MIEMVIPEVTILGDGSTIAEISNKNPAGSRLKNNSMYKIKCFQPVRNLVPLIRKISSNAAAMATNCIVKPISMLEIITDIVAKMFIVNTIIMRVLSVHGLRNVKPAVTMEMIIISITMA